MCDASNFSAARSVVTSDLSADQHLHRRCWAGKSQVNSPIVTRDNDGARARLLALLDEVRLGEALAAVRSLQLLRELVVADAASIDDRVRGQAVLR
jgi:hypothetical protein